MRRTIEIGLDVVGVAGTGCIIYGAWLIYPPAAYLVGGAILVAIAIIAPERII